MKLRTPPVTMIPWFRYTGFQYIPVPENATGS